MEEKRALEVFARKVPGELLPNLVSHRGFHCKYDALDRPLENTLEAFTSAWERNIWNCECDVTHSAEGTIVLAHDKTFERLALQVDQLHTTPVEQLTLKELQQLRLKDGSSILTLADIFFFLSEAKKQGKLEHAQLVVEIKDSADPETIAESLASELMSLKDNFQVNKIVPLVMTFSVEIMDAVARKFAELQLPNLPKLMMLTMLKDPLKTGKRTQHTKNLQISFDLDSEDCLEIVENRLLPRAGTVLDGVYMGFDDKMVQDGPATENLRRLCGLCAVGLFLTKNQADSLANMQKLKDIGVQFINTDVPRNGQFFQ